jgi:hypothetical protein
VIGQFEPPTARIIKSFLLLFFKKEVLPFFSLATTACDADKRGRGVSTRRHGRPA